MEVKKINHGTNTLKVDFSPEEQKDIKQIYKNTAPIVSATNQWARDSEISSRDHLYMGK